MTQPQVIVEQNVIEVRDQASEQVVVVTGDMPAVPSSLVVGPVNTLGPNPGIWVQTFDDGGITIWIDDGKK